MAVMIDLQEEVGDSVHFEGVDEVVRVASDRARGNLSDEVAVIRGEL